MIATHNAPPRRDGRVESPHRRPSRHESRHRVAVANNILTHEEGGGTRGTLVITRDEPNGSIDSSKITRLIKEVLDA